MLGGYIRDPDCVESPVESSRGLDLLPISTAFLSNKETHQAKGSVIAARGLLGQAEGVAFEGYEIHMGRTSGAGDEEEVFRILERSGQPCRVPDGCMDASGRVLGAYIHGLFHNQELRRAILRQIAGAKGRSLNFRDDERQRSAEYDRLAELVRSSLDMDFIYNITGLQKRKQV